MVSQVDPDKVDSLFMLLNWTPFFACEGPRHGNPRRRSVFEWAVCY
jgi:hypothetical protein